jgi:hypothetical protein
MTTAGPNTCSTLANESEGLVDWSTTNNTTTSNNSYTTSGSLTSSNSVSEYLDLTGWGFSIPAGATIDGITVSIERSWTGSGTSNVQDTSLRLLKAGTKVGDDKAATATNWPTSDGTATYGGAADLWGTTWTDSDINASNFGFALKVENDGSGSKTARLDYVTITVNYTGGAAPTSVSNSLMLMGVGV